MNEPEYTKIIALLDAAKGVLTDNVGNLNPADLRIRSLVNIVGKEAQRALLQTVESASFSVATVASPPATLAATSDPTASPS